jgi:hypothetical protein
MMSALQTTWALLCLLAGAGGALAVYLGYVAHERAPEEPRDRLVTYAEGFAQGHGRPPLVLIALYAGIGIWMVGYVLWRCIVTQGF